MWYSTPCPRDAAAPTTTQATDTIPRNTPSTTSPGTREAAPLKITIVQGPYYPVPPLLHSGAEKVWQGLGREFARRGHDVLHLSRRFPGLPMEGIEGGVRHRRIPSRDAPGNRWVYRGYDLLYSLRVRRALPRGRDILVTNCIWLPVLIRGPAFGHLYVHVARYPKRQMRLYRHASRLQAVSTAVAAAMVRELGSDRNISIIPPYLSNLEASHPVPRFDGRPRELLYVGRIHPEKGLDLLIRAFATLSDPDCLLTIVGSWEAARGGGGEAYGAELRRLAQLSRGRIVFEGAMPQERLNGYYQRAALLVYPSVAERGESFGMVPLEGMACGCPAVVSNLDCFRDFIEPGANGFVFDHRAPRPVEALVQAIRDAWSDETRRISVARAGHRTALAYRLPEVATQYLADFESVVGRLP